MSDTDQTYRQNGTHVPAFSHYRAIRAECSQKRLGHFGRRGLRFALSRWPAPWQARKQNRHSQDCLIFDADGFPVAATGCPALARVITSAVNATAAALEANPTDSLRDPVDIGGQLPEIANADESDERGITGAAD